MTFVSNQCDNNYYNNYLCFRGLLIIVVFLRDVIWYCVDFDVCYVVISRTKTETNSYRICPVAQEHVIRNETDDKNIKCKEIDTTFIAHTIQENGRI